MSVYETEDERKYAELEKELLRLEDELAETVGSLERAKRLVEVREEDVVYFRNKIAEVERQLREIDERESESA